MLCLTFVEFSHSFSVFSAFIAVKIKQSWKCSVVLVYTHSSHRYWAQCWVSRWKTGVGSYFLAVASGWATNSELIKPNDKAYFFAAFIVSVHTHTHTHTRTHARTHARARARTHTHTQRALAHKSFSLSPLSLSLSCVCLSHPHALRPNIYKDVIVRFASTTHVLDIFA